MTAIESAINQIERGDIEKGLEILRKHLLHATDDEKYEIAQLYHEWGLLDEASRLVEDLIQIYPSEGELRVLRAELLIDSDQEDEALNILTNVDEEDPVYVQALLLMADLYQLQGLEEAAERKLLQAKEFEPNEILIDFGLAELYFSRGAYQQSVSYYEKVLKEQSDVAGININLRLAEALSMSGAFEEAFKFYENGLAQKQDIHALFGYAFTAFQLERYQIVISKLTELKELDPHYTALYTYLGKAFEHEGAVQEAYDSINEGLTVDDYNKELMVYAGKLAIKLGKPEEAENHLREALALDPGYLDASLTLSKLFLQHERYEQVVDLIDYVLSLDEEDPHFEWDLATAKNKMELYSDALNHYERAYTFFKDNMEFLEEYGYFLLEEGNRTKARDIFTRMLSIDPTLDEIEELVNQLDQ